MSRNSAEFDFLSGVRTLPLRAGRAEQLRMDHNQPRQPRTLDAAVQGDWARKPPVAAAAPARIEYVKE